MTTSFIIEAQKNLKEDPANTAVVFLGKILQQLNQTVDLATEIEPFTSATTTDKLINALWFTSLAFSLATVTVGLLCLQWTQEYKKHGVYLSQDDYFRFRYIREQGFKHWGIMGVISSLPLLLIPSLVAFIGGLLVFLSTTDWAVATPVYITLLLTSSSQHFCLGLLPFARPDQLTETKTTRFSVTTMTSSTHLSAPCSPGLP